MVCEGWGQGVRWVTEPVNSRVERCQMFVKKRRHVNEDVAVWVDLFVEEECGNTIMQMS